MIRSACPVPRSSTAVACHLIERFGSLGDVLAAGRLERKAILADLPDIERTIEAVSLAMEHVLRANLMQRQVLSNEQAVLDYLRVRMAFDRIERFRVLFLNAGNGLLADEELASGTVAAVHAYPREIIRRCLDLGATAILLAHNHPSGTPLPSRDDRLLTQRIAQAAACFDVVVHDHLIIARHGSMSFRQAGYL